MDILDFPLDNSIFMDIESGRRIPSIKVRKIVIGSIESHSGNVFIREILDRHPQILMLGYGYVNHNLFYICIRLAMEKSENILELFWKFYYEEGCYYPYKKNNWEWDEAELSEFNQNMKIMLAEKEYFTSQELFIIIHIAYAQIWNKDIKDYSEMLIYWEPHFLLREISESYAEWLSDVCTSGNIFNVVRNTCVRKGSLLKNINPDSWSLNDGKRAFLYTLLCCTNDNRREYAGWERVITRFEDIKCNPGKELLRICEELEINWSDSLMETTLHGHRHYMGKVTGFDLKPVYHVPDEFYSEFDCFRIALIDGPWQKRYGYPYASSLEFSRKELRDIFDKQFRFEEKMSELTDAEKEKIRKYARNIICQNLWKVRRYEIMEELSEYK